jgi:hypothetical protein
VIQDRDPGDENDAVLGVTPDGVAILRPATEPDHFTADEARDTILGIRARQALEQSDHKQMAGYTTDARYAR